MEAAELMEMYEWAIEYGKREVGKGGL